VYVAARTARLLLLLLQQQLLAVMMMIKEGGFYKRACMHWVRDSEFLRFTVD